MVQAFKCSFFFLWNICAVKNSTDMAKIFCVILVVFQLMFQSAFSQGPCRLEIVNHVYTIRDGDWAQTLLYHKNLFCKGEVDLLEKPDLINQLEINDTVYESVNIDLTKIDVETANQQSIIDLLANYLEYLSLKGKENQQIGIAYLPWQAMFKDFGLLEGRSIQGLHPKNSSVMVVVSFREISRMDIVGRTEEILDLAGQPSGEIFYDEKNNELFRYYFLTDNKTKRQSLKLTYLPRFLIDP